MASSSFGVGFVCGLGSCPSENSRLNARNFGRVAGVRFRRMPKVELPQREDRRIHCRVRISGSDDSESRQCHGYGGEATCGRRELGTATLAFFIFSSSTQRKFENYTDAYEVMVLLNWAWTVTADALAAGLDKYLKRKKLDPLDTYVPTVLLAQSQFQEVDGKLGGEQKTYADARSLLRNGPAASLRTDIRAVAQYAAETGNDDSARAAVDQCLSALEDLDSLLLQASRSQEAPVERMRKDLTTTVSALDRLLATVPTPILEKARAIAEAYKDASF